MQSYYFGRVFPAFPVIPSSMILLFKRRAAFCFHLSRYFSVPISDSHHSASHSPTHTDTPSAKMKFTGSLALLGALATAQAQVVIVPTGPVRGPNTLVFKEIGGVANNECLTFANNVRPPFPPFLPCCKYLTFSPGQHRQRRLRQRQRRSPSNPRQAPRHRHPHHPALLRAGLPPRPRRQGRLRGLQRDQLPRRGLRQQEPADGVLRCG